MKLGPGSFLVIPVEIHDQRQFETQGIGFTAETDHGPISFGTTLLALPTHHLSPDGVTLSALDDGKDGSFEMVHRAIYPSASLKTTTRLDVPTELEVAQIGSRSGDVAGFPGHVFEETTYRFAIKPREVGLHKCFITLRDEAGDELLKAPVVWQRFAFLSVAPDRVILGSQPVRVFLRCPDEDVELDRVVSAPEGVKAVVASTRMVTVRLAEDAPGIIEGTIEVSTTAKGRPSLRIPVVRYAPKPVASGETTRSRSD